MSAFAHESDRDSASPFILWGQALLDDPRAALSDILSGRGARGAQQRAEPEDFLADLMAHPAWQEQRAHLLEGLDTALLNWLEACVEWSPAHINRFGTRAYAARIADALKVAARLPMKITAGHLMRDQSTWDNRFRSLRWPGEIDLLRQFNLVLAQHQADIRFVSRWFAACDEAAWGSPYWQTSLSTGLIGLRKLPDTTDTAPERRVAAALARFAALALQRSMNIQKFQTIFRRRVAALTVLYPRYDGYWQEVWGQVLEDLSPEIRRNASTVRKQWLDQVFGRRDDDGREPYRDTQQAVNKVAGHPVVQSKTKASRKTPRTIDKITSDIDRAKSLNEELWKRVQEFVCSEWTYASRSGDSSFAVRTTRHLCHRLLRLGPAERYLTEIHGWTLQAIEAAPDDAYIWDLWAKVLSELGQDDASISIRWESVRRLPNNCALRNLLANALFERRQVLISENLLRETMRDFPDDQVCRNTLAKLLDQTARGDEAESLLRETMQQFPGDVYSRNILAGLLDQAGRRDEAENLLRETMRKFPDNAVCRNTLAKLLDQTAHGDEAESLLRETMQQFPGDVYSRNILAGLLNQAGRGDEAESLLRETMRKFPYDIYGRNLLMEMLRRQGRRDETDAESVTPRALVVDQENISVYLGRLKKQVPLLESYFTPLEQRNGTCTLLEELDLGASELQLVAAHRVGRMERSTGREFLETWASAHPSSYSARLLLAWQGQEGSGLDPERMSSIAEEFPENRRWNSWLRYGFIDKEERDRIRQEELDIIRREATDSEDGISAAFWGGRSSAVYPGLNAGDEEGEDAVRSDPVALKRLLEDVAFAGAERALPSVSIS